MTNNQPPANLSASVEDSDVSAEPESYAIRTQCPICAGVLKSTPIADSVHLRHECENCGELTIGARNQEEAAAARRAARKLERLRLRGVFIPNQGGPNRKQRRAMRKVT